jgi:hypothetical protein
MVRIPRSQVWSARTYKWVAVFATLLGSITGMSALRLPWSPQIDFDIIGFLFVIQNLPKMVLSFMSFACALVAARSYVGWLMGGDARSWAFHFWSRHKRVRDPDGTFGNDMVREPPPDGEWKPRRVRRSTQSLKALRPFVFGIILVACATATAFFAFFGVRLVYAVLTFEGEGSLGHVGMYIAAGLFPLLAFFFAGCTYLAWRQLGARPSSPPPDWREVEVDGARFGGSWHGPNAFSSVQPDVELTLSALLFAFACPQFQA